MISLGDAGSTGQILTVTLPEIGMHADYAAPIVDKISPVVGKTVVFDASRTLAINANFTTSVLYELKSRDVGRVVFLNTLDRDNQHISQYAATHDAQSWVETRQEANADTRMREFNFATDELLVVLGKATRRKKILAELSMPKNKLSAAP